VLVEITLLDFVGAVFLATKYVGHVKQMIVDGRSKIIKRPDMFLYKRMPWLVNYAEGRPFTYSRIFCLQIGLYAQHSLAFFVTVGKHFFPFAHICLGVIASAGTGTVCVLELFPLRAAVAHISGVNLD